MGWGIVHSDGSSLYSVGYEGDIDRSPLLYRVDIGAWTDNRPNRSSSPFTAAALGLKTPSELYAQISVGIVAMGNPDGQLGSTLEFNECAGLGYGIARGEYCHFSNATLSDINLGRDYPSFLLVFHFN